MDNKLVFLCACLAFIGFASALDCYSCDKDGCTKDKSTWNVIKDCGKTIAANHVPSCAKMTYKEKASGKEYTVRKCVQATKDAAGKPSYVCTPIAEADTTECSHCESDLCNGNSATAVKFSMFALIGVALAYLAPTYLVQ